MRGHIIIQHKLNEINDSNHYFPFALMVIKSDPFGRLFGQTKPLAFIDCLFSQNVKNGSDVSINQANDISTSLPGIRAEHSNSLPANGTKI